MAFLLLAPAAGATAQTSRRHKAAQHKTTHRKSNHRVSKKRCSGDSDGDHNEPGFNDGDGCGV